MRLEKNGKIKPKKNPTSHPQKTTNQPIRQLIIKFYP